MILKALFFYLFAGVTLASGLMVIASRNPVTSVLFLILAFVNSAGLFILLGAEYLALLLVVVYVGAVAVLFLFVVMMLDVDFVELRQGFLQYLPIGALVGLILMVELLLGVGAWVLVPELVGHGSEPMPPIAGVPGAEGVSNIQALGSILYTKYIYFFQVAGLVLLVAMIGAIVLTLRHKPNVKRQNIPDQVGRTREAAVEVRKVESGKGL
ncbi:MAG: NADH-quinone oxidoreductase subunit J [Roseibium sp.]|uniref:NADH-quinone oxidoreductase subunit J n=1 Tax=Roseibium sp. TaxID=1936156 RepID=UPI001B2DCFF8|nr:NADH-quinone oxidoreductase subunit J [Roseibium sp.]MBO6895312.1 NADH-quinone oxidoreductase subunit J [Roseibium sp.]MBO6932237.1 NADH-quinone oxidoreductase subunit J [Roseibium sp.]